MFFNFYSLTEQGVMMGKGDRKSKKGKIFMGSHGKTRPKHKKKKVILPKPKA
jgi:ribosomal small subunit protein bTHX